MSEPRDKERVGVDLTGCYLSQFRFVLLGVLSGTFLGRRAKSYHPLAFGIILGSVADYAYGRCIACKDLRDEYDRMAEESSSSSSTK
jgi:hypothetical protein